MNKNKICNKNDLLKYYYKNFNKLTKIKTKNNSTFRICTYNINLWNNNIENICNLILNINADIVILQECVIFNNFYENNHIKKLTKVYNYYSFCSSKNDILFGNFILSKKEFCTSIIDTIKGYDNNLKCFIKIIVKLKIKNDIQYIYIYGTHLDVHDQTGNIRIKQLKTIFKNVKEKNYLFIGDLNSMDKNDYNKDQWSNLKKNHEYCGLSKMFHTKEINYIKKNHDELKDSLSLLNKNREVSVWNLKRVDYIFSSNSFRKIFKLKNAEIIYNTASDHLPIYSDFNAKLINNWFCIFKINKKWNDIGNTFKKYNIKFYNNKIYKKINNIDNCWNEIFSSILYRFFGIYCVKYNLVIANDYLMVESNFLKNYIELVNMNNIENNIYSNNFYKGFFIDVLLLNYDVINADCLNIGLYNNQIIRQDIGGSLLFRALGTKRIKNELFEKYSHVSILGKEINKGIFKGYCRDDVFKIMLKEQKKRKYKELEEGFNILKNTKPNDLNILKREIKEIIVNSDLKDDYKNSGIKILNDIIYIVKKRLEIYTTHSFKYYLNQMVK